MMADKTILKGTLTVRSTIVAAIQTETSTLLNSLITTGAPVMVVVIPESLLEMTTRDLRVPRSQTQDHSTVLNLYQSRSHISSKHMCHKVATILPCRGQVDKNSTSLIEE